MSPTRTCPRCSTSFSGDVIDAQVGGVCPLCLFQLVLGDRAEATVKAPSSAEPGIDVPRNMGNYEILGMVGAGGMGKVYKARQRGLDRFVAIKVLGGGGQEEIERFFREARASAKLHHPNIIPIHEVVSHEGRYFYAMDFVEGKTLDRAVKDGAVTVRQALEILAKTARAIHYAHEHGVVHRDIKPANILLDARGEPMVADFGLAKDVSTEAGLTQSGYLLGTPSYMAPEQAELDRKSEVDAQSDVYSLGATLYFALTGRPPHEGRSVYEVIAKVTGTDPAPPRASRPEIHRDVETICLKALRRDRKTRYGTALELAEDLERYLKGEAILARPMGPVERLALQARRHRKAILSAAAAVVLALASVLLFQQSRAAHLRIATQPPGAIVEIDGRRIDGVTPHADVSVRAGRIDVAIRKDGHRVQKRTLDLQPGTRYPLELALPKSTGRLSLVTSPEGCAVTLTADGTDPVELQCPLDRAELPVGSYRYRLTRENHLDAEGTLVLTEDQETSLLRSLEPRLLGSFKPKEHLLRSILFDVQNRQWCVLTHANRYLYNSSFPEANPQGIPPTPEIDGLLLTMPKRGGLAHESYAFWERSDGAIDAIQGSYYSVRNRIWSYRMEATRFAVLVPIPQPKGEDRLLFAGLPEDASRRTTVLHLVSISDGLPIWKTEIGGLRREVRVVPDIDQDGQDDLLVWGEGASILSGSSGKEIFAALEPGRKVLTAGVSGGVVRALVFATPEGCASFALPGGARRWEVKNASAPFGAASVLFPDGKADLVLLRAGEIQRLEGDTGRVVWSRVDVAPRTTEPHLLQNADPDGIPDLVYRENDRLVCLSGADGHLWWSFLLQQGGPGLTALGGTDHGGRGGRIALGLQTGEFMELTTAVRSEGRELTAKNPMWSPRCVAVETNAGYPDVLLIDGETLIRRSFESGKVAWTAPVPSDSMGIERLPEIGVALIRSGDYRKPEYLAISETDGRKLWELKPFGQDPRIRTIASSGGPLRILFMAQAGESAMTVTCRDPASGREIWARTLEGGDHSDLPDLEGSDPLVVALVGRPPVPGNPEVQGRLEFLSPDDGRTLRTLPFCLTGRSLNARVTDLDGDGKDDLVLASGSWVQGVSGDSGRILWMRYLRSRNPDVPLFVRTGARGKEIVVSGPSSTVLGARDGATLKSVPGTVRVYAGDRWISSSFDPYVQFDQLHPETLEVLQRVFKRGIFRTGNADDPLILSGGDFYRLGFGRGGGGGAGVIHLLPLSFEPPGATRAVRKGPGGTVDVSLGNRRGWEPRDDFPNTAQGAAEAFLYGIEYVQGALLRKRVLLEGGEWPSPSLINLMDPPARSGLAEWLLDRPEEARFEARPSAKVLAVEERGDEATISLNWEIGGTWTTLRARRIDGTWKIVLKLTADDVRRLYDQTPRSDRIRHASVALKVICSAEADFKFNDRDRDGINAYWTGDMSGLYHREEAKLIEVAVARADPAPLSQWHLPPGGKPTPYHGYFIRAIVRDAQGKLYAQDLNRDGLAAENQARFGFCAYPVEYSGPEDVTLIVTEENTIYAKDTNGKPVLQLPADLMKDGWKKGY